MIAGELLKYRKGFFIRRSYGTHLTGSSRFTLTTPSTVDGTSWTMVVTLPNGTSCLLAKGEAWENVPKVPKVALGSQT